MEKLPQDVQLEIFSRLPAESILEYKQVCKSWLSLLNRLQLILMGNQYLNTPDSGGGGGEFGFILLAGLDDSDDTQLFYRKYDENDEQQSSYKIVKKINHPFTNLLNGLTMIGSCNGLICLSATATGDPAYIFNPITREYVHLPRLFGGAESYPKGCNLISGFGYHPSTNEYKVVRIFYADCAQKSGQVQVYTLGAGSGWRDKGEVPLSCMFMHGCRATLANGMLHWLDRFVAIVAFNLEDEEFYYIASLPGVFLDGQWNMFGQRSRQLCVLGSRQLCVLGGSLGLAHHVKMHRNAHVDIWLLKKKSTTGYDMNEQEDDCGGWNKEFTIPIDNDDIISLLALTKRGEVLFWSRKHYLCCYDPKLDASDAKKYLQKEVKFYSGVESTTSGVEKLDASDAKKYSRNHFSIPHVNTFVSLKALGESVGVEE